MIGTLIIVGLFMVIIGFLICLYGDEGAFAFLWGVIGAFILSGGLFMYAESRQPTAMDVYQGKTTLQITYRDSIPVDSIVVFKEKKK